MPHVLGTAYTIPAQIAGSVYRLATAASAAASGTKVTVPVLGNANMRFVPEQTNGTNNASVPANQVDTDGGWRISPLIPNSDPGSLLAGTLNSTIGLTATAALGACTVTVLFTVNGAEVARATSAAVTLPANTATSYPVSVAIPQTALATNATVGVIVYLTAPINTNLSTTTVTLNYAAAGTRFDGITYTVFAARGSSDTVGTPDATTRTGTYARPASDSTPSPDAPTRTIALQRKLSDTVVVTDGDSRVYQGVRATSETQVVTDAVARRIVNGRATTDAVSTPDAIARAITYGRFVDDGPSDYAVRVPTRQITGVSRDFGGAILPNCTMRLWREVDNVYCGSTTSDAAGKWAFVRDQNDLNTYNVTGHTVQNGVQIHGISDRGLSPTAIGA